jgi:hypothetical protein
VSFVVRKGKPEVEPLWKDLDAKLASGSLSKDMERFFKLLVKAARLLADNPRYPGLNSHEISSLTKRYGCPVWENYLQNNAPAAGRIFWVYGPGKGEITIIGIEPHPEDTVRGYARVKLTDLPEVTKSAEPEQKQPGRKKR